jgi:transposase
MDKDKLIHLRKKVKTYAKNGFNNSKISRLLGVTRDFVIKWKEAEDPATDGRGWKKGKLRKYSDKQEQMIIDKRKDLEGKFFLALGRSFSNLMIRISPAIL